MSHRENKSVFHSSKILIKLKKTIGILRKRQNYALSKKDKQRGITSHSADV